MSGEKNLYTWLGIFIFCICSVVQAQNSNELNSFSPYSFVKEFNETEFLNKKKLNKKTYRFVRSIKKSTDQQFYVGSSEDGKEAISYLKKRHLSFGTISDTKLDYDWKFFVYPDKNISYWYKIEKSKTDIKDCQPISGNFKSDNSIGENKFISSNQILSKDDFSSDPIKQRVPIKLSVFYNDDTLNYYKSSDRINIMIEHDVAYTQLAFDDSLIPIDLVLVYRGHISFKVKLSMNETLEEFRDIAFNRANHPIYSAVRTLDSNLYMMIADTPHKELVAGLAYLGERFSLIRPSTLGGRVFAHELGHNFYAQHNREQLGILEGVSYNFGYNFTADDQIAYSTIMSYGPGLPIPYFSNPNVRYKGQPTGQPLGSKAPAYNAKTITDNSLMVKDFRFPVNNLNLVEILNADQHVYRGTKEIIKFKRYGKLDKQLVLNIRFPTINMIEGVDYSVSSTQITFMPGQFETSIDLDVFNDQGKEIKAPQKSISVELLHTMGVLFNRKNIVTYTVWPNPSNTSVSHIHSQLQNQFPWASISKVVDGFYNDRFLFLSNADLTGVNVDKGFVKINATSLEVDNKFSKNLDLKLVLNIFPTSKETYWIHGQKTNGETVLIQVNASGQKVNEKEIYLNKSISQFVENDDNTYIFVGTFDQIQPYNEKYVLHLNEKAELVKSYNSHIKNPVFRVILKYPYIYFFSRNLRNVNQSEFVSYKLTDGSYNVTSVEGRFIRVSQEFESEVVVSLVPDMSVPGNKIFKRTSLKDEKLIMQNFDLTNIQGVVDAVDYDMNGDIVLLGQTPLVYQSTSGHLLRFNKKMDKLVSALDIKRPTNQSSQSLNYVVQGGKVLVFGQGIMAHQATENMSFFEWVNSEVERLEYPLKLSSILDSSTLIKVQSAVGIKVTLDSSFDNLKWKCTYRFNSANANNVVSFEPITTGLLLFKASSQAMNDDFSCAEP